MKLNGLECSFKSTPELCNLVNYLKYIEQMSQMYCVSNIEKYEKFLISFRPSRKSFPDIYGSIDLVGTFQPSSVYYPRTIQGARTLAVHI